MIDLGHFALVASFAFALYGCVGGFIGARAGNKRLCDSAEQSLYLVSVFSVASLVALGYAFVTHQYSYAYVWQHSDNSMPWHYRISAIWGGMDGSMLLWAAIMAAFAGTSIYRLNGRERLLRSYAVPVLCGATGFFLFICTFLTNPFRFLPTSTFPPDGNGLNPLLQNPSMMIHPPTLYFGFTGFAIPFAFCMAALMSGQLSTAWIQLTRRWTLIAWGFLTAGIIMGGHWAYIELGWGGFWAWDPVENASFLPWLTATAFLHSVMVQERRGMLKVWNVSLAVMTYTLTVFGTFLTRSGIVQSVHAFAETDVGWVFLVYMVSIVLLTVVLIKFRWRELRPENRFESFWSREAAFLFNNLFLLAICFATFWGVMFPVFSEAVTGRKSVVGPPFFNQVNVPLFLILLFLMSVGPLIAWRRSSRQVFFRMFLKPLVSGSAITLLFLWVDAERALAAVSFGLCTFVVVTIFSEIHRAARARAEVSGASTATGVLQLLKHRPRRYGGFLVHFGVAIMAVGITASTGFQIERDVQLKVGESVSVGRFEFRLRELQEFRKKNYFSLFAHLELRERDSGEVIKQLKPERRFYPRNEEVTTEVDIYSTLRQDVYVALASLDVTRVDGAPVNLEQTAAIFKIFINPLQVWLWFGSIIVLFGTVFVIGPRVLLPEPVRAENKTQVKQLG